MTFFLVLGLLCIFPFQIVTVTLKIFLFLVDLLLPVVFFIRFIIITMILYSLSAQFFKALIRSSLILFIQVVYNVPAITYDIN